MRPNELMSVCTIIDLFSFEGNKDDIWNLDEASWLNVWNELYTLASSCEPMYTTAFLAKDVSIFDMKIE